MFYVIQLCTDKCEENERERASEGEKDRAMLQLMMLHDSPIQRYSNWRARHSVIHAMSNVRSRKSAMSAIIATRRRERSSVTK